MVERIHLHAARQLGDPQHAVPGVQLTGLPQRRGQLAREEAIAFGPGEHAAIVPTAFPWRRKTVPAGEVVNAGPGRHHRTAGSVVVAAAVIQVPAQQRIVQARPCQPAIKSNSIQRKQYLRWRHF